MEFFMCTITSGSSGNCTLIQAGESRILVDVGISGKKAREGLEEIDIDPATIDAIVITHEHSDHIKGVGIFSRKYNIPIYATELTWEVMDTNQLIGKVSEENRNILYKDIFFKVKELTILPYGIYHDAADPVGYIFEYKNKKITFATDLGKVDDYILDKLKGTNGLLLEFNHDVNMLEAGGYPYPLKKRILSDVGHLNNEDAAEALIKAYHKDLEWVVLGHLSNENNLPDLAYLTAKMALEAHNIKIDQDIRVTVADRYGVSPIHEIKI